MCPRSRRRIHHDIDTDSYSRARGSAARCAIPGRAASPHVASTVNSGPNSPKMLRRHGRGLLRPRTSTEGAFVVRRLDSVCDPAGTVSAPLPRPTSMVSPLLLRTAWNRGLDPDCVRGPRTDTAVPSRVRCAMALGANEPKSVRRSHDARLHPTTKVRRSPAPY